MRASNTYIGAVLLAVAGCAGAPPAAPTPAAREPVEEPPEAPNTGHPMDALAAAIADAVTAATGPDVVGATTTSALAPLGLTGPEGAEALRLDFSAATGGELLGTYYLVPWQRLASSPPPPGKMFLPPPVMVVTGDALVFGFAPASSAGAPALEIHAAVSGALELERNRVEDGDSLRAVGPEGMRVIIAESRRFHVTVQVAEPGSDVPTEEVLASLFPGRMLELIVVPDMGNVRRIWIPPSPNKSTN